MAPTLMAKKSVLMCFKRLDNEDSIVKQGKKHIYSLFPRATKRFLKNGTWACVPSRGGREDKSKITNKSLTFCKPQLNYALSYCLVISDFQSVPSVWTKREMGRGRGHAFRFLKKKKKKKARRANKTY